MKLDGVKIAVQLTHYQIGFILGLLSDVKAKDGRFSTATDIARELHRAIKEFNEKTS